MSDFDWYGTVAAVHAVSPSLNSERAMRDAGAGAGRHATSPPRRGAARRDGAPAAFG
jgi:hypothetical protein